MNKVKIIIAVISITIASCSKGDEVLSPDSFQVSTDRITYSVGDTVRFKFSGDAENIVFWSGVPGEKYEYRDRTSADGNTLSLNFKSFSQSGIPDQSNISLLVSTDFTGIYDSTGIKGASWQDVSDRAHWSTGDDQTPSGEIDLTDFAAANKDMAIAFRYATSAIADASVQNRWVFRSFELKSTGAEGGTTILATVGNAGWKEWSFLDPATKWTISASQLVSNRSFTALNDDWVITKLFNPNKVMPDRGLAIKNIATSLTEHGTVYDAPGTYRVTFVATNASSVDQKTVVRALDLTITP